MATSGSKEDSRQPFENLGPGQHFDGTATMQRVTSSKFDGAVILAIIIALTTTLLMLVYLMLFLYNRIRYPGNDAENNDDPISLDAIKSGAKREGPNSFILTKEDLQVRAGQEAKKGEKLLHKVEQERTHSRRYQSARGASSEELSEVSDESNVSGQIQSREELCGPEDGLEKSSPYMAERLAAASHFNDDFKHHSHQEESVEQARLCRMLDIGQHYSAYWKQEASAASDDSSESNPPATDRELVTHQTTDCGGSANSGKPVWKK